MNMDVLSRVFNILQRVGGMEQIGQFMTIVYGIVCVFWYPELPSGIPYPAVLDDDLRISHRRGSRFWSNVSFRR